MCCSVLSPSPVGASRLPCHAQVLDNLVSVRNAIAATAGFESYADLCMESRMLSSVDQVLSFLHSVEEHARPLVRISFCFLFCGHVVASPDLASPSGTHSCMWCGVFGHTNARLMRRGQSCHSLRWMQKGRLSFINGIEDSIRTKPDPQMPQASTRCGLHCCPSEGWKQVQLRRR